jgi:RimJ/RimL family protein N-acetyltransferase
MCQESVAILYNKFKPFRTIIGREFTGTLEEFGTLFMRQEKDGSISANGIFWVVDDFVGVFYLTDIIAGEDATVHYSFFDRRHKGRVDMIRQMLLYIFESFGFRRVTAKIPLYAKESTHIFTEKHLGFTKEGRLRKAIKFDNKWFDVNLYGMLREEIGKNGPTA